jgi:hypothetical protein
MHPSDNLSLKKDVSRMSKRMFQKDQGDQIGRTFAHFWVIVSIWPVVLEFAENRATLFHGKSLIQLPTYDKYLFGMGSPCGSAVKW